MRSLLPTLTKVRIKRPLVMNKRHLKEKNNKLLRTYGITLEDYQTMVSWGDGKCSICAQEEKIIDKRSGKVRALAVDHDHKTGIVRGLLCSKCNRGLGMFNENIQLLEDAVNYLIAYKESVEENHATNSR